MSRSVQSFFKCPQPSPVVSAVCVFCRCRHAALGKCVHCVPLEVRDPMFGFPSFPIIPPVSFVIVSCLCLRQPFDEDYLNHLDPPVKHMSFHAYLRKLTGGADKWVAASVFFLLKFIVFFFCFFFILIFLKCCVFLLRGKFAALENISCKVKSGCEGHPPWPDGICTKCQPSAITLNRQV